MSVFNELNGVMFNAAAAENTKRDLIKQWLFFCFHSASRPIGYLKLKLISYLTEQYTDMMRLLTVLLLDSAVFLLLA